MTHENTTQTGTTSGEKSDRNRRALEGDAGARGAGTFYELSGRTLGMTPLAETIADEAAAGLRHAVAEEVLPELSTRLGEQYVQEELASRLGASPGTAETAETTTGSEVDTDGAREFFAAGAAEGASPAEMDPEAVRDEVRHAIQSAEPPTDKSPQ